MYLILENTNKSFSFPDNKRLMVGNDSDCDVQINHPKIWGRHFIINQNDYGCVLEVFTDGVIVNGQKITEKCMLDTGDVLQVDELSFRLLDDSYVPKDSQLDQGYVAQSNKPNTSSVFGIRSFSEKNMGKFEIDDLNHDDGWHVFRHDNELHYVDSNHMALLNGLKVDRVHLRNGDVISNSQYKYKVELPGTSGFSKFSPSHPRNVLLSESIEDPKDEVLEKKATGFFKNNLWWMTLLLGLVILLLIVLNNPSTS